MVGRRNLLLGLVVLLGTVVVGAGARGLAAAKPTTVYVAAEKHNGKKDQSDECASAKITSIQKGIDEAGSGDTVFVCPGTYVEGKGTPGTNALEIKGREPRRRGRRRGHGRAERGRGAAGSRPTRRASAAATARSSSPGGVTAFCRGMGTGSSLMEQRRRVEVV